MGLIQKFSIHPLFWVIIGISIITAHFKELLIVFFIVLCHELGHASMALFFRFRIKKIQLLPFGGVVELDEHGNRPLKEELLVILAGPLQHIWMLGLGFFLHEMNFISTTYYELFVYHNLVILLFNLLPIWPLDGGKLLFLLFSYYMSFSKAHRLSIFTSAVLLSLFAVVTFTMEPLQLNLWVIFIFLVISLYHEWKQSNFVYVRFLLERYYGNNRNITKLKPIFVREADEIMEVLSKFYRGYKHPIVIVENNKKRFELDENELLHAYFAEKLTSSRMKDLIHEY
ncbi:M50 family metallopeptidase [Bacillus suaedaesalsae]|uniref:M50 family metallopeptidase n=1 Tax=Bacillus suaedaesalsae TaxID=2810349 RepID=A0ABS2DMV3_9BACI|nr:M50 family metallopeptidase [Bacillus suaedaesalsae]MBM6619741.1 M50 family metallopeptidase [Bacillus suaedaesalsae]